MGDASEGVVRVHEQGDVVRLCVGVGVEGALLIVENLDPRVGVGSTYGDAVQAPRQHVRGGGNAADIGAPGRGERAVRALGAPHPELEHLRRPGGLDDAGRLCGHERLESDDREQDALDQLGLDQRAANAYQRLVGEDQRSLGNGVDIAGEPEVCQAFEEVVAEERPAAGRLEPAQVRDVQFVEPKSFEDLQGVLETRRQRVAALEREVSEAEREDGLAIGDTRCLVAGAHRELVQVGECGQAWSVQLADRGHPARSSRSAPWRRLGSCDRSNGTCFSRRQGQEAQSRSAANGTRPIG